MDAPAQTDFESLIHDMVTRDAIRVPPYPGVAMRVQQVVAGGRYNASDLAKLVAEDQSLAAAVLRAANSVSLRGVERITSLHDAVGRLGTQELCRIAIASSVGQPAAKEGPMAELRRLVWRRSMTSAMLCKLIAERRAANAQEAFVCGLLHDFGWVVGIACLEDLLVRYPEEAGRSSEEWLAIVDMFHVDLGLLTATRWRLSSLLGAVMASHHRPQLAGPYRPMVDIVVAADEITEVLEAKPHVTAADLAHVSLKPEEAKHIAHVLPELPKMIESLMDGGAPPAAAPAPAGKGVVVRADTVLSGAVKETDIPALWVRQGTESQVRVVAVSTDGLAFVAPERPKLGYLTRLKLDLVSGILEIFVSPAAIGAAAKGHRVEAKLFAMSGDIKVHWDKLLK